MVLWASTLTLAASLASLVLVGSSPFLNDLSALGFAMSLFVVVCATESLN
jgi:hypothetical protein